MPTSATGDYAHRGVAVGDFNGDGKQDLVTANYADTVSVLLGNGGTWSWSWPTKDGPADSQTVKITAADGHGGTASVEFSLAVKNVAPACGPITVPAGAIKLGSPAAVSAPFTDPGVLDTHTAVWHWGDGTTSAGTVTESDGSGTVADSHTYTAAGTYTVKLTVTDKDGDSASCVADETIHVDTPPVAEDQSVATNADTPWPSPSRRPTPTATR